jgi:signal transduction histidine kinase
MLDKWILFILFLSPTVVILIAVAFAILMRRHQIQHMREQSKGIELEQQLESSHKFEILGTSVAAVAHDFNNILMAIMQGLDLAEVSEDKEMYLDLCRRAAFRGRDIVTQLLHFDKSTAAAAEVFSLQDSFTDSVALMTVTIPKRIKFYVDLPEKSPMMYFNKAQLFQVIMNLCVNAKEAIEGEGTIVLAGKELEDGKIVQIEVTDTGIGIAPEILNRIFEPLFTTKPHGTGLGLTIVKNILDKHSSTCEVRTQVGSGTSFYIKIPAVDNSQNKISLG